MKIRQQMENLSSLLMVASFIVPWIIAAIFIGGNQLYMYWNPPAGPNDSILFWSMLKGIQYAVISFIVLIILSFIVKPNKETNKSDNEKDASDSASASPDDQGRCAMRKNK